MPVQPVSGSQQSWLQRQSPQVRQYLVIGAAVAVFLLIGIPLASNESGPARKARGAGDIDNILTNADTRELGMAGLARELGQVRAQLADVEGELSAIKDQRPATGPVVDDAATAEMRAELDALRRELANTRAELDAVQAAPPSPVGTVYAPDPSTPARPVAAAVPTPPVMHTIDEDGADAAEHARGRDSGASQRREEAKREKAFDVPSGSMVSGVLITGLDAPTGQNATSDPLPVLVRIKHEAVLPNRFRADVRECFVIAAGYGDLSSERAYLRAESISCVRRDGKVIDTKLDAYLVGEDGKAGLRGRLVSKQGQAIAKALVAGFADGYAQSLQPSFGAVVNAGGASSELESGLYGGVSSSLDRVAKFYTDLANQMFPVVEVDAGRPVTFVVLRGGELQLASQ